MFDVIKDNIYFLIIGLVVIFIVFLSYYLFLRHNSQTYQSNSKKEPSKELETIETPDLGQDFDESKEETSEFVDQATFEENPSESDYQTTEDIVKDHVITSEEDDSEFRPIPEESPLQEEGIGVKEKVTKEKTEEEKVELGRYHILYRQKDNKWYVKREGSERITRLLHTKKEAIAYATITAINQDTNIVIHGKDGKIEKHGY